MIRALWLLALIPAQAGAIELAFPVACILNETCFIQQYVDHDSGPDATDFTCGPLSYDGHDGTDIAVPTFAAMNEGVAVLAASPGTVLGSRDGMIDGPPGPDVEGRECGNGVLIDHGMGWQTQYCHLRQNSVLVKEGDAVETGTPLGLIGQSGEAEFPHLHLTVRRNDIEIDPFAPEATACGAAGDDLWGEAPAYTPGGIIGIGFSTDVPEFDGIKAGLSPPNLGPQSPALVIWAHVFGGRSDDTLQLDITGPAGVVISEPVALERTQARLFRAVGRRLTAEAWPTGTYTGTAALMRGSQTLDTMSVSAELAP